MATVQRLISAAVLALAATSAHAGYALTKPPSGFQPMPAAAPFTQWGYAKAANETWLNSTVRTNTALNVGGRTVTMPAAMRFAANMPRFAAAALYANPYIRTGAALAAWLVAAKVIWDEATATWKPLQEMEIYYNGNLTPHKDAGSACQAVYPGAVPVFYTQEFPNDSFECKVGSTAYGNSFRVKTTETTKPLTKEEFERKMVPDVWSPTNPGIVPDNVPNELPHGTPLPVEIPIINPSPVTTPGERPLSNPWFEPSGDPVPNPNYNPQAEPSPTNQPYTIPGTRIVPSPTPQEPFRVDVQPVDRPTTSPTPLPPEQLNPQPEPGTNPDQQNQDQPKPQEQQSLCEKHPDILACQKLDEVKEEPLGKEEIQIRINPLGGWGPDSAQCPAPMSANVMGHTVELSWQPVCAFAEGLRPIFIAMAWLSAASMLVVVARRN